MLAGKAVSPAGTTTAGKAWKPATFPPAELGSADFGSRIPLHRPLRPRSDRASAAQVGIPTNQPFRASPVESPARFPDSTPHFHGDRLDYDHKRSVLFCACPMCVVLRMSHVCCSAHVPCVLNPQKQKGCGIRTRGSELGQRESRCLLHFPGMVDPAGEKALPVKEKTDRDFPARYAAFNRSGSIWIRSRRWFL